jgi:predicted nucleic acid-binding protein
VIILDTNVIAEVFKRHPDVRVVAWLESLTGDVAVTAITLAELLAGVRRLPAGRRRSVLSTRIDAALQPYRETRAVLAFDDGAADHYADVLVARERAGMPISTADAQIAAICRARSATCATRNTKDLVGTGVELIDPWADGQSTP